MSHTMFAVVLLALLCPINVSAQSLADAARKAAEVRAKTSTSLAKVITDADLKPDPRAPLEPSAVTAETNKLPARAAAASSDSSAVAKDTPKDSPKDEAYWRGRMTALQTKLTGDLKSASVVQKNLDNLESKLDPTAISLTVFGPEILRTRSELAHWTATIEDDNKAIADLVEEGRRAGALPGWLRP